MRLSSFIGNGPGRWTYGSLFFISEETELRKAGEQKEEEERKIKIERALGFCRHFSHVRPVKSSKHSYKAAVTGPFYR